MRRFYLLPLGFLLLLIPTFAVHAQEPPPPSDSEGALSFTTRDWCADSGTICWSRSLIGVAGLRIIGEPNFGTIFSGGGDRVEPDGFGSLAVFGLETNLVGAWLALQVSAITPGKMRFDEQSEVVTQGRLVDSERTVDLDYGIAVGLSLLDGVLVVGAGHLNFDERDFRNPVDSDLSERYVYLNFQPISTARAVFKRAQPNR